MPLDLQLVMHLRQTSIASLPLPSSIKERRCNKLGRSPYKDSLSDPSSNTDTANWSLHNIILLYFRLLIISSIQITAPVVMQSS